MSSKRQNEYKVILLLNFIETLVKFGLPRESFPLKLVAFMKVGRAYVNLYDSHAAQSSPLDATSPLITEFDLQ